MDINIINTVVITIASGLIGGAISYFFTQRTERYKFVQLQKQKAEAVAKLFSKWIKYRGKEEEYLDKIGLSDYYEDLNRLSIEISFWIKDDKLLTDIMHRLQNAPDSKNPRAILGEIRKLILEKSDDKFDAQQITLWPKN